MTAPLPEDVLLDRLVRGELGEKRAARLRERALRCNDLAAAISEAEERRRLADEAADLIRTGLSNETARTLVDSIVASTSETLTAGKSVRHTREQSP